MRENKRFFHFRCCTKCSVQLFLQFDVSRENSCGGDLFPQQQLCTEVFLLGPPAEASSWSEVSYQTCELKNPLEQTNSLKPVKMKGLPSPGFHHAGQLRCGWQRETDGINIQLQPSEQSGVPEDVCDPHTGTYGVSRPVSCASVDLPPSIPPSFFL